MNSQNTQPHWTIRRFQYNELNFNHIQHAHFITNHVDKFLILSVLLTEH